MVWPFKTANRSGGEFRSSLENPKVSLSDPAALALIFGVYGSAAGIEVTREKALSIPAFWQGVNFLAGTIASLPLHVYESKDGKAERERGELELILNYAPKDDLTAQKWKKHLMTDVLTNGRHYSLILRARGGKPNGIMPLEYDKVSLKTVDGELKYIVDKTPYDSKDIIDIPWLLGPDGKSHVQPISRLKNCLGLTIGLEEHGAAFFANGGVPTVVLEGPAMSPEAAERAGNDVKNTISKAMKEGRPPALPEGYKLNVVGVDPEKSQMHDARRFQIEEVSRILDLPPVFLHDLTKGTFNNTEQSALNLVKHTLTNWLVAIEQEFNLKLIGREEMQKKYCKFNVDGLLRGDFKTRMEGLSSAIQSGHMTPDEARELENRPAKGGKADDLHLQMNMTPLANIGDIDATEE